jgi:uncharacterized protein (DUF433 family)
MTKRNITTADVGGYGVSEVARYLRIPDRTLATWKNTFGIIAPPAAPSLLSFTNVLELHIVKGMRLVHGVPMQRIRRALEHVQKEYPSPHPLVDREFETDGVDIFIKDLGEYINVSRYGQRGLKEIVSCYLQRIGRDPKGNPVILFPFVTADSDQEPRDISMNPKVAFGKPVIAGTGISTAIVAARFKARESVSALAEEYGLPQAQIEEAVRWETIRAA